MKSSKTNHFIKNKPTSYTTDPYSAGLIGLDDDLGV